MKGKLRLTDYGAHVGVEFVMGPNLAVMGSWGGVQLRTSSLVEECRRAVRQLALQLGLREAPVAVFAVHSHLDEVYRGLGLGRLAYQMLGAYLWQTRETFIVTGNCDMNTTLEAWWVWRSLSRDYPSASIDVPDADRYLDAGDAPAVMALAVQHDPRMLDQPRRGLIANESGKPARTQW